MDSFSRHFFQFRDTRLAYYEFPAADPKAGRTPIVFLHATGFTALTYQPLFEKFRARSFPVYALDFSGHGQSEASSDFEDWYYFRDQVLAFLDHLELDQALGIGHSLGGASLLLAAAADPRERFHKLVGLDPVVMTPLRARLLPLQKKFHPLARAAEKRREVMPSRKLLERSYRRSPTFRDWDEDCFQAYINSGFTEQDDGTLSLNLPGALEAKVFRTQNTGHWKWFRRLTQPVYMYVARNSLVAPATAGRLLTGAHPDSRLEFHDSGSHFFPMEDPLTTADRLIEFFES